MKPTSILIAVLALAIFQSCNHNEGQTETTKTTNEFPVTVMPLTKQEISTVVQTSGLFTTDDETNLSFKTGGVIEKIFVKEGDAIKKGQLLATLNLTEINAQVAQAKLAFEKAKRDFMRAENLFQDSVATLEQYQNARTGFDVAQKQLEAANFNRSYSEIRALSNGYVLRKQASEGQVISPGTTLFQTNGASQSNWKLRVGVSDREWSTVSVGDIATVATDALEGQRFDAIVSRKSEGTDASSGSFTLELTIKNPPSVLASGLFGKASIQASRKVAAWSIPYDALLDGNGQSGYVFTTNDLKTVEKTKVVVGSISRDRVQIVAGLEGRQHVVISGSAYLKDGSVVKVVK
jgi:RND family efflux transporter MFP subunit